MHIERSPATQDSDTLFSSIIDYLESRNTKLAKQIQQNISSMDLLFYERAEIFFTLYQNHIESQNKPFQFGIDCFLQLQSHVEVQRSEFLRSGRYPNRSFEEVTRCVYTNPSIMQQYMHGLVFAQFLWPEQYHRFAFFCNHFALFDSNIKHYLEIGGGHGLYVNMAARMLSDPLTLDIIDISQISLDMAKSMTTNNKVHFELKNVFDLDESKQYDFITMGEVLEHVEDPMALLLKIKRLLSPKGHAFISSPANAPMIDHIYLFNNIYEIKKMLTDCGFNIVHQTHKYALDIDETLAERLKIPLMYAAFVN